MARSVQDRKIKTRESRDRLQAARHPYFRELVRGLHLGYRKHSTGTGGAWIARIYLGGRRYRESVIGMADDYLDSDGVQVLSFDQAQEKAREIFRQRSLEISGRKPITVAEAMHRYSRFIAANRKSLVQVESYTRVHILPLLGDVEVAKLTSDQIEEFTAKIAATPRRMRTKFGEAQRFHSLPDTEDAVRQRKVTANAVLTILKAALNRIWREGGVETDKAWRSVSPFRGVSRARVRYLTLEECQRLIKVCEPHFAMLTTAALVTGARYSELARLRVEDFHVHSGTITIRTSKTNRPRNVEMTNEGIAFFSKVCRGRSSGELMLYRSNGEAWGKSNQSHPLKVACITAGIPAINFHAFRHTWASLSIMNGLPLMVVSKNLGHADTKMVERHYGHLAPSYVRDAIRRAGPQFQIATSLPALALDTGS